MGHLTPTMTQSPLLGKRAVNFVLPQSNGISASINALRQGEKAILIFWATWCPNCYEELGTINDSLESIEQKGIKIILIDIGEAKEVVKDYFNHRQMKLVSFIDGDSSLQEPFHLVGIPTLIFIDEKGIIRSVAHEFPSNYDIYFK